MTGIIVSNRAFSPQNYLEGMTDKCYTLNSTDIAGMCEEIEGILEQNGIHDVWGRPLNEIDTVLGAGNEVVLVELTGDNEDGVWDTEYRWYEITDAKNMEVFK